MDEPVLPYNGTEGYVSGSDSSRARAVSDAMTGKATERQRIVLEVLDRAPAGMTWQELGVRLGLHHGQISGTLSVLHSAGKIAALKKRRNNCQPYVAMRYARQFHPDEVLWEPSKTAANRKRQALEAVAVAAREALNEWNLDTIARLDRALGDLDAIG